MPHIQNPTRRKTRVYADVLSQLEAFCHALPAGARLPTHRVLMRQLDASERATLRALEELHRSGRVIRRNGAGTFVAERTGSSPAPSGAACERCVVAIAEPESLFFDRCVAELFRLGEAAGISLVCKPLRPGAQVPRGVLFDGGSASGYLFFGARFAALAKQLRQEGCRVVLVGDPAEDAVPEVPCVYSDPEQGTYLAARHLLELGHRRLAFCGSEVAQSTPLWQGCLRALRETSDAGLSLLSPAWIEAWIENPGQAAKYFRGAAAPTAILAPDDCLAVRVLAALNRAGVPVPRRVSVMGCEASPESERAFPSLTTIDPGLCQQLREALRLLTRPIPPPLSHATVVVPALLRRESTSAPPVDD